MPKVTREPHNAEVAEPWAGDSPSPIALHVKKNSLGDGARHRRALGERKGNGWAQGRALFTRRAARRLRVTQEQKQTLIQAAKAAGSEVSAWLRSLGLR